MANQTLTGTNASYLLSSSLYTLTNLGVVGSGSIPIGLTFTGTGDTIGNSGTITGSSFGVSASSRLSVTNSGTGSSINGSGASGTGIRLAAGGDVTNLTGGIIGGYIGISAGGGAGTVVNAGQILVPHTAANAMAIGLSAGGTVTNRAGGLIGGAHGVQITGGAGSVVNLGQINSDYGPPSSIGVYLSNGGQVVNGAAGGTVSTAAILGYAQAVLFGAAGGAGTVVNYGSIYGQGQSAVLMLTNGTVINGASGATGAEIWVGAAAVIDIAGVGTVTNYGTIRVAGGGEPPRRGSAFSCAMLGRSVTSAPRRRSQAITAASTARTTTPSSPAAR
ncbi:MAG: hypothetical protein WCI94_02120 [Rhodospirillales bacterium]